MCRRLAQIEHDLELRGGVFGKQGHAQGISPHSESCLRISLSVMAMKCQGWVFLEDCARRPALRMAIMTSSGRWSGVNLRTALFKRIASDTFIGFFNRDLQDERDSA